jgi:hypothetical protein
VKHTAAKITASGDVTPAGATGDVAVTLFKRANGKFTKVQAKVVPLSGGGKYSASFGRPAASQCKITAGYQGDATHKPSSTSTTFAC